MILQFYYHSHLNTWNSLLLHSVGVHSAGVHSSKFEDKKSHMPFLIPMYLKQKVLGFRIVYDILSLWRNQSPTSLVFNSAVSERNSYPYVFKPLVSSPFDNDKKTLQASRACQQQQCTHSRHWIPYSKQWVSHKLARWTRSALLWTFFLIRDSG